MKSIIKKIGIIFIVVIVILFVIIMSHYQSTSSRRLENQYLSSIHQIQCFHDEDQDGLNDQDDILQGALEYVRTHPKYKSRYYKDTGYPNDGYGVCSDVVIFALKAAGYNVKDNIQKDIALYPEDYDIEKCNPQIDFRRVQNLKIYFSHNAIALTTNVQDIEQWQGGDIVVFEKHIGIISDRRNENGVPYVIHHQGVFQKYYEEDILEKRKDIVGHYRIGE